jgi:hypothetical protein
MEPDHRRLDQARQRSTEVGNHLIDEFLAGRLTRRELQECLEGGKFEYVPGIRTADTENFAAVRAVLDGAREPVRCLEAGPGTLTLFRGRYSLHRVTPVQGATRRVNAVLAYASTPGHRLTPLNRRLFYGEDEDAL